MPPRHAYWTIIYGDQATAFRAGTSEELLPTLRQLQRTHTDAVLKYFARGKLWSSAEEARLGQRRGPNDRRQGARSASGRPDEPRRGSKWRPGGEHRDARDRFKVPRDVKRKRFKARLRWNAAKREPGPGDHSGSGSTGRTAPEQRRRARARGATRPPKKDDE
jgi:hypothetical protein